MSLPVAGQAGGASIPVMLRDVVAFAGAYWVPVGVLLVVMAAVAVLRERVRGDQGGAVLREYRAAWTRVRPLARLRHALPMLFLYPLIIGVYCAGRLWLNREVPFTWDARLADVEGQWLTEQLIAALAAFPPLYRLTEFLYGVVWIAATYGVMTWVALWERSKARTQYFLTLAIVFPLAGNLLAGLLMSAGPAYYGEVVQGVNPYAYSLSLLDTTSTYMRPGQHALWSWYCAGAGFPSTGVTAMPSMHLVVATLASCAFWERGAKVLAVAVVLFTLIGSTVTLWHYWLDGIAGIAVTLAVWFAVAPVIRRQ